MRITFLGTGTSQGVPVIACECETCKSDDKKDNRLRSSVLVEVDDQKIVIDAGPDFRQQMLRVGIKRLDAILLTHSHKDHIGGLDDVRAFNYVMKKPSEIYAEEIVHEALKKEFHYVFTEFKYPGIPKMNLHTISEKDFFIAKTKIQPIRAMHHELPVLGFRVKDFAYLTDTNKIIDYHKLKNLDVLVLDALRKREHLSHFTLEEALNEIKKIKPKKAYLTHISHLMGKHEIENKLLPENVEFAYDTLVLEI